MPDLSAMISSMRSVAHFRDLPAADLQSILTAGSMQRHSSGSIIFLEDEACAGMYVLLAGEVHLVKLGPSGQQNIVSVIRPVIMFNEVPVLDGGPNPLTALAAQDSRVWRISHEAFQDLLQRYPSLGLSLLRVLARRNRMLVAHYHDLSFLPVLGRVAKLLLELSANGRQPIARHNLPIAQMASRIATVPEAVSRALKELRTQEIVTITRSTISVERPQALAAIAQIDY